MAQQIRFLYDELRQPRHDLTTQQLGQIITRTFDALDAQGATTINSTTVVNQIVSGLWTQTGKFLYPTVTSTTLVLIGTTSSDFFFSPGQLGTTAAIGMMSAAANAAVVYLFINPGIETQLVSNSSGTGTLLPLSFYCGGLRASISTGGTFYVGTRTSDLTSLVGGEVVSTASFIVISASSNASLFDITIFSGLVELVSSHTGTGTTLPIAFLFGVTEAARFKTDGSLLVGLTSTDIGTTAGMVVVTSSYFLVSNTTNASTFQLHMATGTSCQIISSTTGTGTLLPIAFLLAATEISRFDTHGALLVGITSSDISNGTGEIIVSTELAVVTAATNASVIRFIQTAGTANFIQSTASGTGTTLPIAFAFGGTEVARFTTNGAFLGGLTSSDAFITKGDIASSTNIGMCSATTNASLFYMTIGSSLNQIVSSKSGTGTVLPIIFNMFGTENARITTAGVWLFGLTSTDLTGLGTGDLVSSAAFIVATATTNASIFDITINASLCSLFSTHTGTGTTLPIAFFFGATEVARFRTAGSLLIGLTSSDITDAIGTVISGGSTGQFIVASATVNASWIRIVVNGTTETILQSSASGTGTTLPLSLYAGGTRVAQITSTPRFFVNKTTDDGSGAVLQVAGNISVNGTVLTVP